MKNIIDLILCTLTQSICYMLGAGELCAAVSIVSVDRSSWPHQAESSAAGPANH